MQKVSFKRYIIIQAIAAIAVAVMLLVPGKTARAKGPFTEAFGSLPVPTHSPAVDTVSAATEAQSLDTLSAATGQQSLDMPFAAADSHILDTQSIATDSLETGIDTAAMVIRDSLLTIKIDSLVALGEDSLAQMYRDSLFFATDTSDAVVLSEREIRRALKRRIRDSIYNYKDSLIRATPRLLATYIFPDSIMSQRMFLWKTDGYFNKPKQLNPDTTFNDNFHELPYLKNDVGATYLGVAGSAMQYYNYFKREECEIFPFYTPYKAYTHDIDNMPFYNVKTPYTELAYWGTLFATKLKEETNVKFLHTQNLTPSFNFNILYKRVGGKGILENESTDNRTFAITGNYIGKRYVAQGGYIFNRVKRKENGGVADPAMILDTIVDARTIPVRLTSASSALKKNTLFITHSYGIPFRFKKIEAENDTLGYGEGTMAYIGHTGEFTTYSHSYKDMIALSDTSGRNLYNNNFFINPTTTADSARVMNLDNRFFIRIQPWAKEAIVSKVDGGIGYQYLNIYSFDPSFFLSGNKNRSESNLYLYFGASGELKKYFAWEGFAKYNLAGYNSNDFRIGGELKFSAYPLKRGIHLTGRIDVSRERPNFFFNNYYSNHYVWNNDFDKTTETRIEGKLEIPDYKLELFFGYSLLNNNLYLDTLCNLKQNGEAMSVLTAYLKKDFKASIFHFDHKVLFQLSSKQEVVPLPELALNLRYYLQAPLVKNVLTLQLGVDATFTTKFYAQGYSPALGMFFNQRKEKIGENPYMDVFINMQWKRASIFVKYVNALQDWPTSDYFSANRYLRPQKALKFGVHWPFYIK